MLFRTLKKDKLTFKKSMNTSRFKLVTTIKQVLLGLLGMYDEAQLIRFDELTLGYLDDEKGSELDEKNSKH